MSITKIHAQLVDIPAREIRPAKLTIEDGRIARVEPSSEDCKKFLLPGFVDSHVHVESSMLSPAHFAQAAVVHGTVATVSDPHEIANVLGLRGVRFMLDDAKQVPFKFAFGAPSCVPATVFETAGSRLLAGQIATLLDDPAIYYLSEVMNFPGVLAEDPDLMALLDTAKARGKPIDGHAPGLRGDLARQYHAAGITTDHECTTIDEAVEKIDAGALIQIREGSAARNFDALWPLIDRFPGKTMLCSDDKHPDELVLNHINALVRRAVANGADVFNVLTSACITPVNHYALPVGLLRVGDPADFIEVDSLSAFNVHRVFIDGVCVAENECSRLMVKPANPVNKFVSCLKQAEAFEVVAKQGRKLRVIGAIDGQLMTESISIEPTVRDGLAVSDPSRDILKIASVNRYQAEAAPAVSFIRGFGLTRGAIAGSVGHDSHNVLAVGVSNDALCRAVNAVIEAGGGLVAVDGERIDVLPLPIAGLMSTLPCDEVASEYLKLCEIACGLGSPLRSPYMTLSFMGLLVIPRLKLSDLGLFDGDAFELVDRWV